jgi:hypothetical protein
MQEDLTAREQLIRDLSSNASESSHVAEAFSVETKSGKDATFVLPDGQSHESRTSTIIPGPNDKVFWVNLIVACDGPQMESALPEAQLVLRDFAKLENARNDVDAFYSYYRPMRLGDPRAALSHGVGKSPGFFDKTVRLDNPTRQDLSDAVGEIRHWIRVNQRDEEYQSVQLNFMFAGHGYLDKALDTSGVVIADGALPATDLAELVADSLAGSEIGDSVPRIDLFLDCCHSGGIVRALARTLLERQREGGFGHRIGRVYCSCLDDESSFELPQLHHGVFAFAYLNEYSRLRPAGAERLNIALRDIGWVTKKGQHPFLLDFVTKDGKSGLKFPSAKYIDKTVVGNVFGDAEVKAVQSLVEDGTASVADDGVAEVLPIDLALEVCRHVRAYCDEIETDIFNDRSKRSKFLREELWDQTWRWS